MRVPVEILHLIALLTGECKTYLRVAVTCKKALEYFLRDSVLRRYRRCYSSHTGTVTKFLDCKHSFDDEFAIQTNVNARWFRFGKLHREGDQPALVASIGLDRAFYLRGKQYFPENIPTTENFKILKSGNKFQIESEIRYFRNHGYNYFIATPNGIIAKRMKDGLCDSLDDDTPAVFYPSGRRAHYYRGKLHRINGPARYVVSAVGTIRLTEWFRHGVRIKDPRL